MPSSKHEDIERDPQGGALIRIRGVYPSLKAALQKVADLVMSRPEMAIYASVNEVAAASQVSEATVMRLCRTLGFKGFQDFKIALARELVTPSPRKPEEVAVGGEPAALVRQVFGINIAAMEETLEILDQKQLQQAVKYLLKCRRLVVVAVSGSALAVQYADQRFNSLGLLVHGFTERHQMLTAVALMTAADVLVCISHFGTTKEVLDAARVGKDNGARVIVITSNSISPLSRMADVVLTTASRDIALPQDGLASLLCQISIIDSLFALLQQARPNESQEKLAKIGKALQSPA